jgi:hypothetical protein
MMTFHEKLSILNLMKEARQSIVLTYNKRQVVEKCQIVQVINNEYIIIRQRKSFFSNVRAFLSIDAVDDIKIN